ncbi:MAG: hypothetical protein LBJ64_05425 [Deltaproteobacteria bacterium]|nr:hypothetical protein [Deltaproteobacteria bacterium]
MSFSGDKNSKAKAAMKQAGSLMILGWEGTDLAEPLSLIEKYRPAGLIFFKRNYPPGGGEELRLQLRTLQARALEVMERPLLLAIDNEGGTVRRLPEPHLQLPSASEARELSLGDVFELSLNSARELNRLGFNLNLAPVADLEVAGSFMGTRCYSGDPLEVAACVKVFVEGFRAAGVLCCAKHFPGLGAANKDPHNDLPTVSLDKKQMQNHLKPFRELIQINIPMVMTSHCRYPGVGVDAPATFAPEIPALLRREMNFEGLVLTDDLEMGAVSNEMDLGEAAVKAILAGHDAVLVCRKAELIEKVHQALVDALISQVIKTSQFIDIYGRLCSALDGLGS